MNDNLLKKYEDLKALLLSYESVAIAYSSGVDSTFLLYAAKEALGDKVIAITASSYSFPKRELNEAKAYCQEINVKQRVIISEELKIEGFSQNPPNRCYICKKELFLKIKAVASEEGIKEVAEGSNLDDNGDYRPGLQAVAELGIKSPLREIGFTKKEIRSLSEYFNLPTWDKPSYACLASRFPYGDEINEKKLVMVDKAEQLLMDMGFRQLRVRIHGNLARIEVTIDAFERFMDDELRDTIYSKFKEFGFYYVSLDLKGYRTGSMNETLN